jgi:hypothetical protein
LEFRQRAGCRIGGLLLLGITEEFRRKLRTLRSLCQDIVELRRGDHSGARLNLEQEQLGREREKTEEEVVEHFKRWAENQQVRDWICQDWVRPEEREYRLCAILGLEPKTPDGTATDGPESSPVKPNQTESNQMNTPPYDNLCHVTHNILAHDSWENLCQSLLTSLCIKCYDPAGVGCCIFNTPPGLPWSVWKTSNVNRIAALQRFKINR